MANQKRKKGETQRDLVQNATSCREHVPHRSDYKKKVQRSLYTLAPPCVGVASEFYLNGRALANIY